MAAEGPELLEVVHLGGTTFFLVVGQASPFERDSNIVDSTSFAHILREGPCSQGASCAVGGSGVPPYRIRIFEQCF